MRHVFARAGHGFVTAVAQVGDAALLHGCEAGAVMVLRTSRTARPYTRHVTANLPPATWVLSESGLWLQSALFWCDLPVFPPGRFFWEVLALLPRSAAPAPSFKAAQP